MQESWQYFPSMQRATTRKNTSPSPTRAAQSFFSQTRPGGVKNSSFLILNRARSSKRGALPTPTRAFLLTGVSRVKKKKYKKSLRRRQTLALPGSHPGIKYSIFIRWRDELKSGQDPGDEVGKTFCTYGLISIFHMKGFSWRVVLKQRHKISQKWFKPHRGQNFFDPCSNQGGFGVSAV